MKYFKSIALFLGLPGLVWGGVPQYYNNVGVIDTPTNISAVHVNNYGIIEFDLSGSSTLLGTAPFPYNFTGTAYFTNTGTMAAVPGFHFAEVGTSKVTPSTSFFNRGEIFGEDGAGEFLFGTGSGQGSGTIPSDITVEANSIINQGTLEVGQSGGMSLTGKNVNLSYGITVAGGDTAASPTGTEEAETYLWDTTPRLFTEDAPGTFDLIWGTTNGLLGNVANIVGGAGGSYDVFLPPFYSTNRGFGGAIALPIFDEGLSAFAFMYPVPAGQDTNYYYDVVLLNTNFTDTNTSVTVQFADPDFFAGFNYVPPKPNTMITGNFNGIPILVTYSETTIDPISGEQVVNSIYVEDDGDTVTPIIEAQNVAYSAAYGRPDSFEVSFTEPPALEGGLLPSNTTFDPTQIYIPGKMAFQALMTNAFYEVQIGNDPENLDGAFPSLTGLETLADIPDPTNAPGRIEINANNLNLSHSKLAASGLVTVNATNLIGLPAVFNYGTADLNLTTRTNSLVISNLVPVLFEQLRGYMDMYSATWDNMQTNETSTNTIHTHLLYIGQSLSARYIPTVRNFHLKSTNMVIASDVEVIKDTIFNGQSLTIVSNLYLTQDADNFYPAAAPNLRHLFVTNNASFAADNVIDVGFPPPITVKSPIGRGYSVLTITNEGTMAATAITLQAATIDIDGTNFTINDGSIDLAAQTLNLGTKGLSPTNQILSGGTVTLSANTILASNSIIQANQLTLTPVKELADFVAGSPAAAVAGPISDIGNPNAGELVNFWYTTNGVELTRKATKGDLYGTQIQLIANPGPPVVMAWAGADKGDTAAGFQNNAVIGTLILDRILPDSILQFQAAGNKNAIYVNNLVLQDASLTNYNNNTFVDPHLKIYFATANVPVNKITNISPQFIYAVNAVNSAKAAAVTSGGVGSSGSLAPIVPAAVPPAGVYNGLFAPATGASATGSGFLTFVLGKDGAFSGRATTGSTVVPFSSRLAGDGSGYVAVGDLSLAFVIDSAGHLLGNVDGEGWSSELNGVVAATSPVSFAGSYTMTLPGPGAGAPAKDSLGRLIVGQLGAVTASGRLADGAAFSQSTHVSQDGQWPFYSYSPVAKDVLMGWLNFSGNPAQLSGSVTWIKPATAGGSYPKGFESAVPVTGAASK